MEGFIWILLFLIVGMFVGLGGGGFSGLGSAEVGKSSNLAVSTPQGAVPCVGPHDRPQPVA